MVGEGRHQSAGFFGDERNVPAILEFLEETMVGKIPGRILLAGGPDLEEEDLECLSLRVQEEEQGTEASSSEEEDGPAPPPLGCTSPLSFFLFGGI